LYPWPEYSLKLSLRIASLTIEMFNLNLLLLRSHLGLIHIVPRVGRCADYTRSNHAPAIVFFTTVQNLKQFVSVSRPLRFFCYAPDTSSLYFGQSSKRGGGGRTVYTTDRRPLMLPKCSPHTQLPAIVHCKSRHPAEYFKKVSEQGLFCAVKGIINMSIPLHKHNTYR
jgi:hypothetical protein